MELKLNLYFLSLRHVCASLKVILVASRECSLIHLKTINNRINVSVFNFRLQLPLGKWSSTRITHPTIEGWRVIHLQVPITKFNSHRWMIIQSSGTFCLATKTKKSSSTNPEQPHRKPAQNYSINQNDFHCFRGFEKF